LSLSAKNLTNLEPFTPHYLAVLTLAEEANKGLVWGRVVVALMPIQKKGVLNRVFFFVDLTKCNGVFPPLNIYRG
jgi:hypothetical protein